MTFQNLIINHKKHLLWTRCDQACNIIMMTKSESYILLYYLTLKVTLVFQDFVSCTGVNYSLHNLIMT